MYTEDLFFDCRTEEFLTPISQYITNGVLDIDKSSWQQLNKSYSKEDIIGFLVKEVSVGNIKFPYRDITIDDAVRDFNKLRDLKNPDFEFGKITTRFDYKWEIKDKFVDCPTIGNMASDYFQQKNRFKCEGHGNPSPIRTWETEAFLFTLFKALWTLKVPTVNSTTLRTIIALRKYVASQFKPSFAKFIYDKYNATDVIDFSAGWGDRLCGFYASKTAKTYIGIDPNKDVYSTYYKQRDLYSALTKSEKTATFINLPAEDSNLGNEVADLIFTSPPYFNAEKYTEDGTQSFKRYKTIDSWLTGFMFPTLDKMCDALKSGGHLIINISDVYTNGKRHNICDPMNDYLNDKKDMHFEEAYGMKMAKRPQSLADDGDTDTTFIEPVWVWRKD